MDLKCFDRISLYDLKVKKHSISVRYMLEYEGLRKEYKLLESYEEEIVNKGLYEIASIISIVPAINYGLFTDEIKIDFPVNDLDKIFFLDMMKITSHDIFVSKLVNKTGLIKDEYIPAIDDISPEDAEPEAYVNFKRLDSGTDIDVDIDYKKSGVMSSGGKDSLTTYGILKEVGLETYPFFLNEAGRHWIVSLKAYKYMKENDPRTKKVWSNIDRLFAFIEKNMKIVKPEYWKISNETYPIRLFWFEHYVFSFLPLIIKYRIGNISLGNEYDDPTGLSYDFNGIKHYYGIYDQSQEFDKYMSWWFEERGFHIRQWSPIRSISGLIVERILYNRYPYLFKLQTSCHSSHIKDGEVYPCGKCSKCVGILIFLLANNIDPHLIRYNNKSINKLPERIDRQMYRLDESELEHSLFLINRNLNWNLSPSRYHWYVETIRFDPYNSYFDNIPYYRIREKIYKIFEEYTSGYSYLKDGRWIPISRETALKGVSY